MDRRNPIKRTISEMKEGIKLIPLLLSLWESEPQLQRAMDRET